MAGQVNLIVTGPQFGSVRVTPGSLVLSGSGGTPNTSYYILTATNLATPLPDWTPLLTNQFDASGNFHVTNSFAPRNRQQFYRLEVP